VNENTHIKHRHCLNYVSSSKSLADSKLCKLHSALSEIISLFGIGPEKHLILHPVFEGILITEEPFDCAIEFVCCQAITAIKNHSVDKVKKL